MKELTKKRFKAIMIDSFLSSAVSLGAEYFLRKKIKNEAFHGVVTPIITQYALEYVQLKSCGQTVGYKLMGLELVNQAGNSLTDKQIIKRMAYRDTMSTINYIRDRKSFEQAEGALLPHDIATETIVRKK
ncbi:RDD family protein [Oceanobacillus sp. FSL H7-0719]|uniref:RDD family protein n=1 Tax=Oceanobacillus sp. FSL H7-0719 TaxID=2954507 RepID=UPI00324E96CB